MDKTSVLAIAALVAVFPSGYVAGSAAKPNTAPPVVNESGSEAFLPYVSAGVHVGALKAAELSLGLTYWQKQGSIAAGPIIMATLGQDFLNPKYSYQSIDIGYFGEGQGWPAGIYFIVGRINDDAQETGRFMGMVLQALLLPPLTIRKIIGANGESWEFGILLKYPFLIGDTL